MERASNLETIQTRLHRIAELASDVRPAGVRRFAVAQRTRVPEEPDAGILHVRICGGPGPATARVYPTPIPMLLDRCRCFTVAVRPAIHRTQRTHLQVRSALLNTKMPLGTAPRRPHQETRREARATGVA